MTEFITIDCYAEACDANYVAGKPLPDGKVIFVNPEDIDEVFLQLSFFPDKKVILVSAHSDYGIHYQEESHPNKDIKKHIYLLNWQGVEKEQNYIPLQIVTWNPQRCNPHHRFSVKIDRHTICTFPKIPDNVIKWYCCNANINEPQVEFLPFGVNNEGHGADILPSYHKEWKDKTDYVYFNLQYNSVRRIQLHEHFRNIVKGNEFWLTYREAPTLSIEDFYTEMASHSFILNCESNGLDSYRNWEALIIGSVPLVENNRWAKNAVDAGFNFIVVNNLMDLQYNNIAPLLHIVNKQPNNELLKKTFWQEKIRASKDLL